MPNDSETDARSAPPRTSETFRNWLDVIAKVIGALAIAGVTWVGYKYQSKASLSSVINQREQAESQLRASMLSDLVEPIMGKNGAASENADPERQRLLAEMVTLNFHDHFEFKPLLLEVDARLLATGKKGEIGHGKLASDARRVIDRQINMLTSIGGISGNGDGYPAKTTRVDLIDSTNYDDLMKRHVIKSYNGNCTGDDKIYLKKPSLVETASMCVSSPDNKVCLLLDLFAPNYDQKSMSMSTFIYYNDNKRQRQSFWPWGPRTAVGTLGCNASKGRELKQNAETLDEAHLSIFDFPLTDNSKIVSENDEYRYSVSLYYIDKPTGRIVLKIVWFPQGYVTERERPPPTFLR